MRTGVSISNHSAEKFSWLLAFALLSAASICSYYALKPEEPDASGFTLAKTAVAWVPTMFVGFLWWVGFEWRVQAVRWLMTYSFALGVIGALAAGLHFNKYTWPDGFSKATILVVLAILAFLSALFSWGTYKGRDWVRKITLRVSQVFVILTIVEVLTVGIKAHEAWATLDSVLTWYWMRHPEVVQLFEKGGRIA